MLAILQLHNSQLSLTADVLHHIVYKQYSGIANPAIVECKRKKRKRRRQHKKKTQSSRMFTIFRFACNRIAFIRWNFSYTQSINALSCVQRKTNYINSNTMYITFFPKERNFRFNSFVMTNGRIFLPLFVITGYWTVRADVSVDHHTHTHATLISIPNQD